MYAVFLVAVLLY